MTAKFIAEIGSNHNGDFSRAQALVKAAARAGCDGVKFQLFKVHRLFSKEALARNPALRAREALELPEAWLEPLCALAHRLQMTFGVTPFDLGSVAALARTPFLDFAKVSSYSLLDCELLNACARLCKPLVVSTGMATDSELIRARWYHLRSVSDLTLLHCVSKYPVRASESGLDRIGHLRSLCGAAYDVGLSDHSASPAVVLRAVLHWHAQLVECHLDLDDRQGSEYRDGHCWCESALRDVIWMLASGESADVYAAGVDDSERLWRADPADGLRPLLTLRAQWHDKDDNNTSDLCGWCSSHHPRTTPCSLL